MTFRYSGTWEAISPWHMWGNHIKIPMVLCLQPAVILCAPTRIVLWFIPDTSEAF